jgi:uncharacterized protein
MALVFRTRWLGRHVIGVSRLDGRMPITLWCDAGGRQIVSVLRQLHIDGDLLSMTVASTDGSQASDWQYIPIRRLAIYIETSLYAGTSWVVFEPNNGTLWSRIRLNVNSFMQGLFMQGELQGQTPDQAYFVKCDAENNPPSSIGQGVVNILVGFAPMYPAEFVVISIQQICQG